MRKCDGFTLVEILVSVTLGLLIMSLIFELFLANQRSLRAQIALSTLITRMYRVTAILRNDIHRAQGKVSAVGDNQLQVNSNTYLIDKNKLVVIDANHRKTRLVEEVSNMKIIKYASGIDVSMRVAAGSFGKTIHVFTSLK